MRPAVDVADRHILIHRIRIDIARPDAVGRRGIVGATVKHAIDVRRRTGLRPLLTDHDVVENGVSHLQRDVGIILNPAVPTTTAMDVIGDECEVAVNSGAPIIGINNRDLKTFTVDIETTGRLRQLIPNDRIVVSESGIKNRNDIERLKSWDVNAVLIGESLMASADIAAAMKEFL